LSLILIPNVFKLISPLIDRETGAEPLPVIGNTSIIAAVILLFRHSADYPMTIVLIDNNSVIAEMMLLLTLQPMPGNMTLTSVM
jgi:hypothetical protein